MVTSTYPADFSGGSVRHPRETIQGHLDMIDAICNRDVDRTEEIMRRHMRIGREKFIRALEQEAREKKENA